MVQAWVGHKVTPLTLAFRVIMWYLFTYNELQDCTNSTNDLTNTITVVMEPLAPSAAWILCIFFLWLPAKRRNRFNTLK